MNNQEAPVSLTVDVKIDGVKSGLLTFRGDSVEDFIANVQNAPAVVEWAQRIARISAGQGTGGTNHTTPAPSAPQNAAVAPEAPSYAPVSEAPSGGVEEQTDKWGNRFQRGVPGTGFCAHGPRVIKHGTSKAGKKYKAYACVNDSPFGDYKQGKCELEFPN